MSRGGILLRVAGWQPLQCNVGGSRGQMGKVGSLLGAVSASSSLRAPRLLYSCASTPNALQHQTSSHTNNTHKTRRLLPIARAWDNSRSCSSHASSSLVKMASDRDILSDEYVSTNKQDGLVRKSLTAFANKCQAHQL